MWSDAVLPQPRLPLDQDSDSEEASTSSVLPEWLYLSLSHNCDIDDLFGAAGPVRTPRSSALSESRASSKLASGRSSQCAVPVNRIATVLHPNGHVHHLIRERQLVYLNSLLDLLDGRHCLRTTGCRASWRHELRPRYLDSVGTCLCVTRETIGAVGCTAGVFTTQSIAGTWI